MKFVKRFLPLLAIVALILASCATNAGQVPKGTETPSATTPGEQPTTTAQTPVQPSVEKYELQNLFQQATTLKSEATNFALDSVLPDKFKAASDEYDAVAAEYKNLVETPAQYDGVKAYPLKDKLTQLVATWDGVVKEGMPLRAEAEKAAADDLRFAAMNVDAQTQAPTQYDAGLKTYSDAAAFVDASNFSQAIETYQLAGAMFDNAAAAAQVNVLRADIEKNGYAKYDTITMYYTMAEDRYNAAQDLWLKNTKDDITASTAALKEAQTYYAFVDAKGAELRAYEGKDLASKAQEGALNVKADINAPDEYKNAIDIQSEANKNMQDGSYVSAYLWYQDAATAFDAARDASNAKAPDVEKAIAQAESNLADAKSRAAKINLDNNIYLQAASEHLDKSKTLFAQLQYNDATFETNEVSNYIGLSDNMVNQAIQAQEKARLEQLAKDKEAADIAIADAKARMAWADQVKLQSDYPQQYKDASTSMSGAEIAYGIEKYTSAKTLADEVSTILSDSFQKEVLAAREAAKIKAAQAEEQKRQKAANKQAADVAIADAEARMAWANENNISADYPEQYKTASTAMVGAYTAYGNEDYVAASQKAQIVSNTFSEEFASQVAADRAAKEQLAKDKAAADTAIAAAKARMAWADQNGIKADYPAVYKDASTSMSGAEIAYGIEKYSAATEMANQVTAILSSDFEAKVTSDREIKKAADAADALGTAHSRMAWADQVNLSSDYPNEYRDASTSMQAADQAYSEKRYDASLALSKDVMNILSDEFMAKVNNERAAAAQAKALAEQKAADKKAADIAIADAETRMAWANDNNIRVDYPDEYKMASVAMVGSYVAYGNEDYVTSAQKAKEVSDVLSDSFEAQVTADRAAAAQAKALAEQKAADKAAADVAIADAEARMAWANENNISADYPEQYKTASTAMVGAYTAYGNEDYVAASQKAQIVSNTFSEEFASQVAADRAAKEQLAKDKAAADTAIAAAKARMAWADQNGIKADYPAVYKDASTSMSGAEIAYGIEKYSAATEMANQVTAILSSDFEAKVTSDREIKKAADAADALGTAHSRMAWADQVNLSSDYPNEYRDASTSMQAADQAYSEKRYDASLALSKDVMNILSDEFMAKVNNERAAAEAKAQEIAQNMKYAQVAISDAQSRYDWAASKNAIHNYPELFTKGGSQLADAKAAFNAADYVKAKDLAGQAYWTLMQIGEFAPLPAAYTVRLIPARRDCLWRIAEYSFIYNNPYKWPVLYKENKATFRDPSNPHLIYPGQVLKVPSIKGETREGMWDPLKTYQPLAK